MTQAEIQWLIDKYSQRYGIKPEIAQRMFNTESNFDPNAVSGKGAQGLGQLMPETAKSLGVTDVNDPEQNIEASLRYLKQHLDRNNGDYRLALASYNAGPGAVAKYGGIPPFKETQDYVNNIMGPPTKIDWGAVAKSTPKIDWAAVSKTKPVERRPEIGEGAESISPRADNPVVNWFEDLKGDIRGGTGITAPGRFLRRMGSAGAGYTPESNIVGGPFVGPPEVGHGISKLIDPDSSGMERVRGANEGIAGVAKTLAPILGVTNPAFLPMAAGYGGVGELAHKGAELFTDDPDKQELVSNLAMIASPGGKRLLNPAGEFVSKAAPVIGQTAGIGTGLVKSFRTANPAWLLTGMPPITAAVSKLADLTGRGMQKLSDIHPFEGQKPVISPMAEINNSGSRISSPGKFATATGTRTFRGKMGMDEFAPPERLNPKLPAGPIITPPPEPIVDNGPIARPAMAVRVPKPSGRGTTKQFLTSTAEKGEKVKPAQPLITPPEPAPQTPPAVPDEFKVESTGLEFESPKLKAFKERLKSKSPETDQPIGQGDTSGAEPTTAPLVDTSAFESGAKPTFTTDESAGQNFESPELKAFKESLRQRGSLKPQDETHQIVGGSEQPPLVDTSSLDKQFNKTANESSIGKEFEADSQERKQFDEQGMPPLVDTSGLRESPVSNEDANLEKWWASQEPRLANEVPPENKFPESNMEDIFNIAQGWVKSRPEATREEFVSRFAPRGQEAAGQAFDAAQGAEHIEKNPESLIQTEPLTRSNKSDKIENMANPEETPKSFEDTGHKLSPYTQNEFSNWLEEGDWEREEGKDGSIEFTEQGGHKFKILKDGTLQLTKGFDEGFPDYDGRSGKEAVKQWLDDNLTDMNEPPPDNNSGMSKEEIEENNKLLNSENKVDRQLALAQALLRGNKTLMPEATRNGIPTKEVFLKAVEESATRWARKGEVDTRSQEYKDLLKKELEEMGVAFDKALAREKDIKELEGITGEKSSRPQLIEPPKPEEENNKPKGTGVAESSKKERKTRSREDIVEDQDIVNNMREDLEKQGQTAEKVRIARVKPDVGKKTGKTYSQKLQEQGIDTGDEKPLIEEPKQVPTTKKQALAEVNKLFDNDEITPDEYEQRVREIEHRFRTNQP